MDSPTVQGTLDTTLRAAMARSRRRRVAVLLVLLSALVAIPVSGAGAHGVSPSKSKKAASKDPNRAAASGALGVQGLSERRLRKLETKLLGAGHAAEHAKARRPLNRKGGRAKLRRSRPRSRSACAPPAASAAFARTAAAGDDGFWSPAFPMKVMGIHTAMLPTGKVMFFSYPRRLLNPANNSGHAWLWDPSKGTGESAWTNVPPPLWRDPADGVLKPANIWCAGQSFLADGRLLVTGGNLAYDSSTSDFKGLNKIYTFNPWSETWTEQPDMRDGRWYPEPGADAGRADDDHGRAGLLGSQGQAQPQPGHRALHAVTGPGRGRPGRPDRRARPHRHPAPRLAPTSGRRLLPAPVLDALGAHPGVRPGAARQLVPEQPGPAEPLLLDRRAGPAGPPDLGHRGAGPHRRGRRG